MDEISKKNGGKVFISNTASAGDRLKTEEKRRGSYREKFRTGKKRISFYSEQKQEIQRAKAQGKRKIYADAVVARQMAHQIVSKQNEDENAAIDAANYELEVVKSTAGSMVQRKKEHLYANKCYEKSANDVREQEKDILDIQGFLKQTQKKQAQREAAEKIRNRSQQKTTIFDRKFQKRIANQAEILSGKIGDFVKEHVTENPEVLLVAAVIGLLILVIVTGMSSCGMMSGGLQNVTIATSFTAEDGAILGVEEDYIALEEELRTKIKETEVTHPDYDEYRYFLAEIGHNPYQLAALLTVLFEDYTREEVQEKLREILNTQYELIYVEVIEERTKEEDGEEITYEYHILEVTLTTRTFDEVILKMHLSADQMERYGILLETYGNKPYLFGGDIYQPEKSGEYGDYEIPPEFLTSEEFANMIREAEKYLGMKYVWGGSSPSTGFDCSGFVSYVLNHCGNGWNVGRQSANGLLGSCSRISEAEAKPGNLIFFQGTYNVSGASHVGIYVGNGMMIHCGNPIQYTSINTAYWKNHFLAYGRIQ